MFFQDVPMHWENLRRAFENTRSNWDIVVPLLERVCFPLKIGGVL